MKPTNLIHITQRRTKIKEGELHRRESITSVFLAKPSRGMTAVSRKPPSFKILPSITIVLMLGWSEVAGKTVTPAC